MHGHPFDPFVHRAGQFAHAIGSGGQALGQPLGHALPEGDQLLTELLKRGVGLRHVGVDFDLDQPVKRIQVSEEHGATEMLFLGVQATLPDYFSRISSGGKLNFVDNKTYRKGSFPVSDMGDPRTPEFTHRMLNEVRTAMATPAAPLPAGVTDVRMFRISVANTLIGITAEK